MRKTKIVGMLLILVGLLILAAQFFSLPSAVAAIAVGLVFLILRTGWRVKAFSIIGSILLCTGMGFTLTQLGILPEGVEYGVNIAFFAISFFMMHIIEMRRMGNWPLFPGIVLVVTAGIVFVGGYNKMYHSFMGFLNLFWPVLLISVGAALAFGGWHVLRNRKKDEEPVYAQAEQVSDDEGTPEPAKATVEQPAQEPEQTVQQQESEETTQ